MKQLPANPLTALTLLLCVAVGVLWVRSYWRGTRLRLTYGGETPAQVNYTGWTVRSESGRVVVDRWTLVGRPAPGDERLTRWYGWMERPVSLEAGPPIPAKGRTAGFVLESLKDFAADTIVGQVPPTGRLSGSYVLVPHWLPVLPLAAPGIWRAWRGVVMRRRRGRGACRGCGYDLRATPGRCPECGRAGLPADHVAEHV